jgi:signal transduction histidine kinase
MDNRDMTNREIPPWVVTAALAVATAIGVPAGVALTGGTVTWAGAVALGETLALLVLVRRRWPVTVLLTSIAAVIAYRTAGLVDTGWVWPVTVAYVNLVVIGRAGWALAIGAVHLVTAANLDATVVGTDPQSMFAYLGAEALWLGAVLSVAIAYRNWRRWQDELADRLRREAHERDLDARRRRAEERVRIAHELHDVVSHTLAVVGVHLNVALDTLDAEPGRARAALRLAQDVRGRAMADLKSLVGVLRDDSADEIEAPAAHLDRLGELVERVRSAGITVNLAESGDRSAVPAPVALAAYRVVQEALTNTVRHANATHATVILRYEPTRVTVEVTDDGAGAVPTDGVTTAGHGLAGMRERVAALGGSLDTRPATGDRSGFAVRADLPVVV